MAYVEQSFDTFGLGLNLRDKADAVQSGEAIDAMNVWFTERGAVHQRDGYAKFTSVALTNPVASLAPYYTSTGTKQLLCGCGTRLEAVSTAGAVVASDTALTTGVWAFARFGAPGTEVAYAGNGQNLLQKWNGTVWAAVAATPKAASLCVMSETNGNRLVAGNFALTTGGPDASAGSSNPSRVFFSNPGAPETWGLTNYVDFTPGDGELVQAVVAWRDLVFVFKETKFFVVWGTSTDATGNPVFNYRIIDTGAGLVSPRAVATHRTGVYFMSREGVYRTTGEEPTLLSDIIDPIWQGAASSFYTGGVIAQASLTNCAATFHHERLYLAFPTVSANNRVLVYDPRYEWWSLYDFPASCLASFRIADTAELVFGYASGTNDVGRHAPAYANDVGAAIVSRWRSGWFDYGTTDVKTIRESKVWGTGMVFLGLSDDFASDPGYLDQLNFVDASLTYWEAAHWESGYWSLGSSLLPAPRRRALRGVSFSTYLYNNVLNQPWGVNRLTHLLRESRIASVEHAT